MGRVRSNVLGPPLAGSPRKEFLRILLLQMMTPCRGERIKEGAGLELS
jgi:hypothetical protein